MYKNIKDQNKCIKTYKLYIYSGHKRKTNKTKNTTQYVLDTTIRKQTQII